MKPTESEWEVLRVLWEQQPCTVRTVHEALTNKSVSYTATLKLMQHMLDKDLLKRDSSIRSHVYETIISLERAQEMRLDELKDELFGGSALALINKEKKYFIGQYPPG